MIPLDDIATERLARSWMLRAKRHDVHFYRHSLHVGELARAFCDFLHFSVGDTKRIEIAAVLHDIGKLSIPSALLSKVAPLSAKEMRLIQTHPDEGYRLLAEVEGVDDLVRTVARDHHERLDGTGYPRGLLASSIPEEVRIITLCDVFGAMTEDRPYGTPMTIDDALERMESKQTRLDQTLLKHFIKMLRARQHLKTEQTSLAIPWEVSMDESRSIRDRQIETLAREVIDLLLNEDESAEIVMMPGESETLVHVRTTSAIAASKLTGDKGRTAQSIRTIVAAAGIKLGHRYRFEVEAFQE